jgi:hypothetical protein
LAWTQWADGVKGANPYTAFLTTARLTSWNLGGDRLALNTWIDALTPSVILASMALLPLGLAVVGRRERFVWAWLTIAMIGPLLLFTNLYAKHEYYTAALTPAIAALVGGGTDVLLERWRWVRSPIVAVAALVVIFSWPRWLIAYAGADPDHVLPAVAAVQAATKPANLVVMHHGDWSPAVFFYAERRGVVISDGGAAPAGYIDVGAQ